VVFDGERSKEIPLDLLERVFRVKARRMAASGAAGPFWQFSL
jgi:hypothetical protein